MIRAVLFFFDFFLKEDRQSDQKFRTKEGAKSKESRMSSREQVCSPPSISWGEGGNNADMVRANILIAI